MIKFFIPLLIYVSFPMATMAWPCGEEQCTDGQFCAFAGCVLCEAPYVHSVEYINDTVGCFVDCAIFCPTQGCIITNGSCTYTGSGKQSFTPEKKECTCEKEIISCNPGYKKNNDTCESCNKSCPGGFPGTYNICADAPEDKNDCERACTAADITNAAQVNGKFYYDNSADNNDCILMKCKAGFSKDGDKCVPCPNDKYCDGTAIIKSCPAGFKSPEKSDNLSDCFADCSKDKEAYGITNGDVVGVTGKKRCDATDGTKCTKENISNCAPEINCNTSFYLDSSKKCVTCPRGWWCPGPENPPGDCKYHNSETQYKGRCKCLSAGTTTDGTGKSTLADCKMMAGKDGTQFCDSRGCFTLPNGVVFLGMP